MENVQKRVLFSAALTVLSLLSACSGGFSAAPYAFDVGITPNPLGFDVNVDPATGFIEYIIPAHTLTFTSNAGAVGATIEGYEIEYLESSRNPAFPGDSVQRSRGSLNVRVPPGIICPEPAEGEVDVCTVNSPNVIFERGEAAVSQGSYLLPLDVAVQLYALVGIGGAVGAYAEVTFYGSDDLQRPFKSDPYQVAIQIPVGEVAGSGGQ